MQVKLEWITPNAQDVIVHMARVSNPASQEMGQNGDRLIQYLIRKKHWSPFEMASACFEITTTRDIARQILRHRSFSFQEFSQRYASVDALPDAELRQVRLQDEKNRQNSIVTDDKVTDCWWREEQMRIYAMVRQTYLAALRRGIAKEVARAILPEGLTPSRMFMTGTIRSWIHYLETRCEAGTQAEHRLIAEAIREQLVLEAPTIFTSALTETVRG